MLKNGRKQLRRRGGPLLLPKYGSLSLALVGHRGSPAPTSSLGIL